MPPFSAGAFFAEAVHIFFQCFFRGHRFENFQAGQHRPIGTAFELALERAGWPRTTDGIFGTAQVRAAPLSTGERHSRGRRGRKRHAQGASAVVHGLFHTPPRARDTLYSIRAAPWQHTTAALTLANPDIDAASHAGHARHRAASLRRSADGIDSLRRPHRLLRARACRALSPSSSRGR